MEPEEFQKWHDVWHATRKPGTLVDFLNWTAQNGYQLTKGEPLEPIDPEWAWTLAAEPSSTTPDRDISCETCGSQTHEMEQCDSGWIPGFDLRAHQWHVQGLPGIVEDCEAAGHCGHSECCNCSGRWPDAERLADVHRLYRESAPEVLVMANADRFDHLSTNGGTRTVCGKHAASLAEGAAEVTCPDCAYKMARV